MQRRDFFKVIGIGLTGLFMPEWALVSERKKRMFGEILKRIAQGKPVSRAELDQLENLGNQLELQSRFVTSVQDGTGKINALDVQTQKLLIGTSTIMDISLNISQWTPQTIPTATVTAATNFDYGVTTTYNNGFPNINSGDFVVPVTGYYFISGKFNFDANAIGERGIAFATTVDLDIENTEPAAASGSTTIYASGVARMNYDDILRVSFRQTSGGDLDVTSGRIVIQLL